MNAGDIKSRLNAIFGEQLDHADGVGWVDLVETFNDRYPDARYDLGGDLFDNYLRRLATDIVKQADHKRYTQQVIPGIAEMDATVTVRDAEGGYRRKRVEFATLPDLTEDREILRENVDHAVASLNRADERNNVLGPVMEQRGFDLAGQAIEYLVKGGAG